MQYAICRGNVLPEGLGLNQCLLIGKKPSPDPGLAIRCASMGGFGDFFTFYELELSRLLSQQSIQFGMREARKRNCGSEQCCCCHQLCPYSFGGLLGRKPPSGK